MQTTAKSAAPTGPLTDLPDIAEVGDAPAIAALFRVAYARTLHPCGDPAFVRASLAAGDPWFVHRQGSAVVSCFSAGLLPWTGVRELRFLAVHPDARIQGIAAQLTGALTRWVVADGSCDLVRACTRTRTSTKIAAALPFHDLAVTGHDGGVEFAEGRHEVHLEMSGVNGDNVVVRAATAPGSAASALYEAVGWDSRPPDRAVAPLTDHVLAPQLGQWWTDEFAHDRERLSFDLPAIGNCSRRQALEEVRQQLHRCDRTGVRHVSAVVPASRPCFVRALGRLGFRPTAYLPAWYLSEGVRHDCFRLSRAPDTADSNGQDDHIGRWDHLLAEAVK